MDVKDFAEKTKFSLDGFENVRGYYMKVEDTKAQIYFPSFSYSDYDRSGTVSVCQLLLYLEAGRSLSVQAGFAQLHALRQRGCSRVLMHSQYEFQPTLFFLQAYLLPPLQQLEVYNVGDKSFTIKQILIDPQTMSIMTTVFITYVCFDLSSRKSKSYPITLKDHYKYYVNKNPSKKAEYPECPPDAYSYIFQTFPEHEDENGHVGQMQYARFCMDCFRNASQKGYYHFLVEKISKFPAEQIEQTFFGESFQNEVLTVKTWQSSQNPSDFYFVIMRQKRIIHKARYRFSLELDKKASL